MTGLTGNEVIGIFKQPGQYVKIKVEHNRGNWQTYEGYVLNYDCALEDVYIDTDDGRRVGSWRNLVSWYDRDNELWRPFCYKRQQTLKLI